MRNVLAFFGALVITLTVVGWYENWFQFRSTPGADGNRNLSIDIDSKKVNDDIKKTEGNIQEFIEERAKEAKAAAPTTPATTQPIKDQAPGLDLKQPGQDPKFELNLFGPTGKN
jgi:hypothetical protein